MRRERWEGGRERVAETERQGERRCRSSTPAGCVSEAALQEGSLGPEYLGAPCKAPPTLPQNLGQEHRRNITSPCPGSVGKSVCQWPASPLPTAQSPLLPLCWLNWGKELRLQKLIVRGESGLRAGNALFLSFFFFLKLQEQGFFFFFFW